MVGNGIRFVIIHMSIILDKKAEHGGAWVRIIKEDSKWIYWRLGNYSKSEKEYVTLQECVDEAYNDMLRSKY